MDIRTLAALVLLLLIALGIGAALYHATRERRGERRAYRRGERARLKARDARRNREGTA